MHTNVPQQYVWVLCTVRLGEVSGVVGWVLCCWHVVCPNSTTTRTQAHVHQHTHVRTTTDSSGVGSQSQLVSNPTHPRPSTYQPSSPFDPPHLTHPPTHAHTYIYSVIIIVITGVNRTWSCCTCPSSHLYSGLVLSHQGSKVPGRSRH